jgi:D-3-phosphoglycerate dehydrogenase
LRVVGRAGVGVDNIDLQAATASGILVVNAPQANTISAAEHAMALLLAQARNVAPADASMRAGRWDRKKYQGIELTARSIRASSCTGRLWASLDSVESARWSRREHSHSECG